MTTIALKTIALHVHQDSGFESRLQVALDLARAHNGHLTCIQATGIEPIAGEPFGGMFGYAAIVDTMLDQDKALRTAISTRLENEGVSWDWRYRDDGVIEGLIAESRLADLTVLSQPPAARSQFDSPPAIIGELALNIMGPIMMVPVTARGIAPDAPAMVAWNGSAEAAHALRQSLGLLQGAALVHLVEVSDESPGRPAREAATWLSRHGIKAEIHDWPPKGRRISVALLHAAEELHAGYLVMGAYGHSRLRETVLGGVTRELIQTANLPLVMAH